MFGICSNMMGIPIPSWLHQRYPEEVKQAWGTLDAWVKEKQKNEEPIVLSKMPADVSAAFSLIEETPIPGYENAIGKQSCYIVALRAQAVEEE